MFHDEYWQHVSTDAKVSKYGWKGVSVCVCVCGRKGVRRWRVRGLGKIRKKE